MTKTIFITGTSSGFGELMVKTLGPKGHTIYAGMRDADGKNKEKKQALTKWAEDNNATVHVVDVDVTSESQVNQVVEDLVSKDGKIDVVVNNAGIGNYGTTEGYSDKQIQQIFDVNVFGPMRVVRAALPHMRKQKSGLIVQISSMIGRTVIPFLTPYCSTKFAVEGMFEGIADEVKGLGIDVSIIQPGAYPTNFLGGTMSAEKDLMNEYGELAEKSQQSMKGFADHLKSADASKPQDVADAVLDLVEGQRPRRVIVGSTIDGVKEINDVCEKVQKQLLQGFGLA